MQSPLPFAHIRRSPLILLDHVISSQQREITLSQISNITHDSHENPLLVSSHSTSPQLLTGHTDYAKPHKTIFTLSHNKDVSTLRQCPLLMHHPNVPGGHWTFMSITFGDTVFVSYHDSIQALESNFNQFIQPITDFLRALNITENIEFTVAPNPQQIDGHSCGVYALAGVLALAQGNMNWTLSAAQAACMHQDLCQSIIDVTLSHTTRSTTPHIYLSTPPLTTVT